MSIIKVVPIPNNDFSSNSITITNPIKDNIYGYDHTGTYVVKCSSYTNNFQPYNVFNNFDKSNINGIFWQSGSKDGIFYSDTCDPNSYSVDPYNNVRSNNGSENTSYQGGNAEKWVTNVGIDRQNKIYGEWIQIQIPKADKLYLHDYRILTPRPVSNILTFPTKFMVVGSNDETIWEYIDLQNKNNVDTRDQTPIVFNINSTNSYSYYRLIIMEMPLGNSVIRINHWALNFLPYLSVNKEAFTNYTNYNTSMPLEMTPFRISNSKNISPKSINHEHIDNITILPIICTSILAISILFYYKNY